MEIEKLLDAANNLLQQDLVDYLTEKKSKSSCPVCDANSWEIIDAPTAGLIQIPLLKKGGYPMPPPSVPAMIMVCHNCSYLRLHAALPIAAWKSEKADKNAK